MLIQQFRCLLLLQLIALTFAFGAAKECTIGFGLFGRLLARNSLLKSVQIDQIAHDAPIIFSNGCNARPVGVRKFIVCLDLFGSHRNRSLVASRKLAKCPCDLACDAACR